MLDAIVTLWIIGAIFGTAAAIVAVARKVAARRRPDWHAEGNVHGW